MKVDLYETAVHVRLTSAETLRAAEEGARSHLGRLFVLAPFPLDALAQAPQHPGTDAIGDALAQIRPWLGALLSRHIPL